MQECVVELTIHANPKFIWWLVQADDDRRFEAGEREGATVFPNPDAAVAAAETYLVETAADVERSGKPFPEVTYRLVRW
jgi:hypothetical protein